MAQVEYYKIEVRHESQRLDNFLIGYLKGVPKTRIYRAIRKGEVRVNKKREAQTYRLQVDDEIRIPPIQKSMGQLQVNVTESIKNKLLAAIIHEDDHVLILNKPAGIAVHGGSEQRGGIIEYMRLILDSPNLELAHRLDKDTSGCLVLTKNMVALRAIHQMMREGKCTKKYLALVAGLWPRAKTSIQLPLQKNILQSGERRVQVHESGRASETRVRVLKQYDDLSLIEATLITGRMHQIRVHVAASGYPVVGDSKYGNKELNKVMHKKGLKGLFLHARSIAFTIPELKLNINLAAKVPDKFTSLGFAE